jgi:pSer/pThr/pTyr-binding forkhead associated (FHA) protein
MPTLILEFPNGRKKEYPITGEKIGIGRKPENTVHIPDSYVSGRHAEIQRTNEGGYELVDLGSHNGTEVNGKRVQRIPLRDGDRISFGVVEGRFRAADPAPQVGTPPPPRTGPQTAPMSPAAMMGPTQRIRPVSLTPVPLQPPGAELGSVSQQLKNAREELATAEKRIATLKEETETASKGLDTAKSELEAARKESTEITGKLTELKATAERLQAEIKDLQEQAATVRREKSELTAEVTAAEEQRRIAREDADKAKAEAESHRKGTLDLEQSVATLRATNEDLRRQEQSLTERLQILHRQQFLLERRLKEESSS